MKKTYYRPDIDGLRAIAIIPVLFFHLKIAGFSGGFIGVDVFFVISGYLITSIIVRKLKDGQFSFVEFWERRIRRIVPILFVVLAATTIASYFIIIFPTDFTNFGQSLAAQSLFLVNIFFIRTNDYFAAPAETAPLLHTWSLAVEEQFYIVFPILLFAIFYFSKRFLVPLLITATVGSFLYSVWLVNINPEAPFSIPFIPHVWGTATNLNASFYFPVARAWELFAGALLAVTAWEIKKRPISEIISFAGLATIVLTVIFLNKDHAFPGLAALAPVLGTVAIIAANKNHRTFVYQILSFPVLVGVGLISYSLYLWHWPLIVLTKQYINSELSTININLIIVVSFILSILSYYLIETPFRNRTFLPRTWHMFSLGLFSVILLASTGVYVIKQNGLPERAPEAAAAIAIAAADTNPREYECFRNKYRQIFGDVPPCLLGDQSQTLNPTFVLWGDSHANALMPVFDAIGEETHQQGIFFAVGGCSPLITGEALSFDPLCQVNNQNALNYIVDNNIQTVFLVSSWRNDYKHNDGPGSYSIQEALDKTLTLIPKQTKIVFVNRIPSQIGFDSRKLFYEAVITNVKPTAMVLESEHNLFTSGSRQAIQELSEENENVEAIDPNLILCQENKCSINKDGVIIYSDGNHLNATGALLLAPLITPYFE